MPSVSVLTAKLENDLVVLKIDGRYPTNLDYPSAVTLSIIYKEATITPEARKFVDYFKTEKAKALLSGVGTVPISE